MQKKIAQKDVTLHQKQIDAAKQKLQKDKNAGLPAEVLKKPPSLVKEASSYSNSINVF
ncbi:hypothetical protein FORC13_p248 (plasmid) [Bacillus cereus]|nr:hypothetical protein FORC13_p248 [Bacillus cereus]